MCPPCSTFTSHFYCGQPETAQPNRPNDSDRARIRRFITTTTRLQPRSTERAEDDWFKDECWLFLFEVGNADSETKHTVVINRKARLVIVSRQHCIERRAARI